MKIYCFQLYSTSYSAPEGSGWLITRASPDTRCSFPFSSSSTCQAFSGLIFRSVICARADVPVVVFAFCFSFFACYPVSPDDPFCSGQAKNFRRRFPPVLFLIYPTGGAPAVLWAAAVH
jgi:hypothetical protein